MHISAMIPYSVFFYLLLNLIFTAKSTVARNARIFGGSLAAQGQFPYQVSLQTSGKSFCGGAIIDKRYVVTAAHCVYNENYRFDPDPIKIVAGVNYLRTPQNPVTADVVEVFIPKEYDPNVVPYYSAIGDISVLKLQNDLNFEKYPNIAKVNLPNTEDTYDNVKATVTGFGHNKVIVSENPKTGNKSEIGSSDGRLRLAKTNVLTNSDCNELLTGPIYEQHLCARVVQRDPTLSGGICSGDSGSPLVYNNTLIGVVSTSPLGCNEKNKPGIYTRVSEYVNFIEKVMNGQIDENILSEVLPVVD